MKKCVKWFDNLPLFVKIIFALPILGIIWAIYRIIKGAAYGKIWTLVFGIILIVVAPVLFWLVDLICIIVAGKPLVLA